MLDRNGGITTVAALGGTFEARPGAADLHVGDAVKLVLRPEAIVVSRKLDDGLPARVAARTFLGEKVEYAAALRRHHAAGHSPQHRNGRRDPGRRPGRVRFAEDTLVVLPVSGRMSAREPRLRRS